AQACGERLSADNGLDAVLELIARILPEKLYETAYALAVEIAAADLDVKQEELRFLQLLRDQLELDKLPVGAIEHSARVRHRLA
ncbi:MAG: tellurite resistance TerB family protein, partial [Methyloligellaceae bacterium]